VEVKTFEISEPEEDGHYVSFVVKPVKFEIS